MQLKHLALAITLISSAGSAATLPLKPGTYVLKGVPCAEPPFAATFDYNGRQFSYPHATDCASVVRSHAGRVYRVRETCSALGDGSPTAPTTMVQTYRVETQTEVAILKDHEKKAAVYRFCPKA